MRHRFYAADIGRFMQGDPIGFKGGGNLYAYGGNNPISNSDPFGMAVYISEHNAVALFGPTNQVGFFNHTFMILKPDDPSLLGFTTMTLSAGPQYQGGPQIYYGGVTGMVNYDIGSANIGLPQVQVYPSNGLSGPVNDAFFILQFEINNAALTAIAANVPYSPTSSELTVGNSNSYTNTLLGLGGVTNGQSLMDQLPNFRTGQGLNIFDQAAKGVPLIQDPTQGVGLGASLDDGSDFASALLDSISGIANSMAANQYSAGPGLDASGFPSNPGPDSTIGSGPTNVYWGNMQR